MTPHRFSRIKKMLATRQPCLTVCMEEVHKPNNISALIRTADAVGVHQLHAVWPSNTKMRALGGTSAGARNWVKLITHETTSDAFCALKKQKMQILVTHLSDSAIDFRELDYTQPTAIILGQEKKGISQEAIEMADQCILIPMVGMVESLNVSVAGALILYEAQRQRKRANMYEKPHSCIPEDERNQIIFECGYPILAKMAQRKGLAVPEFDEQGQIIADPIWWAKLQAATF